MAVDRHKLVRLHNTRVVLDADERRGTYRASPDDVSNVRMVIIRKGEKIPVVLLDVSASGSAVCVPTARLGALKGVADGSGPDGWTVGIWTPKLERPLAVPAIARYIRPMPQGVRIGFAFALNDDRRSDLDTRLQELFNQRRAVRVRPERDDSIRVDLTVAATGAGTTGLLRDVSLMGMGALVATDEADPFAIGTPVTLRMRLPGEQPTQLEAVVRYRLGLGLPAAAAEFGAPATHLGIEFVPGALQKARATNVVGGFIVKRQLATRRREREGEAAAE